jgi:hypothetical protein
MIENLQHLSYVKTRAKKYYSNISKDKKNISHPGLLVWVGEYA